MTTEIASLASHSSRNEELWPFNTVAVPTGDFHVAVTDVGRGSPLLFVHVGFWSFLWRDVVQRMRADHRCICVDAPGTGRSADVPRTAITLESAARAITDVIDTLDLTDVTLVFHDLGGVAALAAAARRPERIRALAAINTFAWKPGRALNAMLFIMGSPIVTGIDVSTRIVSRITAGSFGVGKHADASTRAAIRNSIDRRALRAFHRYLADARRCGALYDEIGRALRGPLRDRPLVTVFGERNDPFGFQKEWKRLFPAARQVVVPGGNHFPMCDDPDLVAASIGGLQ